MIVDCRRGQVFHYFLSFISKSLGSTALQLCCDAVAGIGFVSRGIQSPRETRSLPPPSHGHAWTVNFEAIPDTAVSYWYQIPVYRFGARFAHKNLLNPRHRFYVRCCGIVGCYGIVGSRSGSKRTAYRIPFALVASVHIMRVVQLPHAADWGFHSIINAAMAIFTLFRVRVTSRLDSAGLLSRSVGIYTSSYNTPDAHVACAGRRITNAWFVFYLSGFV